MSFGKKTPLKFSFTFFFSPVNSVKQIIQTEILRKLLLQKQRMGTNYSNAQLCRTNIKRFKSADWKEEGPSWWTHRATSTSFTVSKPFWFTHKQNTYVCSTAKFTIFVVHFYSYLFQQKLLRISSLGGTGVQLALHHTAFQQTESL